MPLSARLALPLLLTISAAAQSGDSPDAHVAKAKAAAGTQHTVLFDTVCTPDTKASPAAGNATPTPPQWHAEPAKVFDNLYYVGEKEYSAWAVNTSDGIILVDAIYPYSVEDEIVNGLRKLGLDPARIKYVIISHAHLDHAGGARYLQEKFGAHVVMSAADWDTLAHDKGDWPKPKKDMVATDGQKLTLGDATITMYLTPGHTAGTISLLIPVKDHGQPHLAATWGGTAFNWLRSPGPYITPDKPNRYWFEMYRQSAEKFRSIVAKANADVLLSNHTKYDGTKEKLPVLAKRKANEPNPYVIGNASVQRYLTVAEECAQAGRLRYP